MNALQAVPIEWRALLGGVVLIVVGYTAKQVYDWLSALALAGVRAWFGGVNTAVASVVTIAATQLQIQGDLGRMQENLCSRIENVHREAMGRIDLSDARMVGTVGALTGRVVAIELKVDAIDRRLNGNGHGLAPRASDRRRPVASTEPPEES